MSDPTPSEPPPAAAPIPGVTELEGPQPPAPPAPPADTRPQYEFDESQNAIINELALGMMWVRIPLIIVGVLQGIIAVGLAFRIPQDGAHVIGVIGHALAAVVCFLLSGWLLRAAAAFARVTTTTGRDITNMMTGLKNLASWFELLAFFVKLYLILLGILLLLLLVGLFAGAFKGPVPA
jgi:hypothetical protein